MYNTYIARQAIFDAKNNTIGYELLFRDSPDNKFPAIDKNIATAKLIIQNHIHGDIKAICMGKKAFINFTEHCLINKYPLMFDNNSIVIEIVGHQTASERLIKIVKFYHNKGYKIALNDYDLNEKWDVLFPYISILKIDIEQVNPKQVFKALSRMRPFNIKLAAEKVETVFQRQSLAEVGFNYFQGFFYHVPEIIEGQTLAPMKAQMLNLISETFKEPFSFNAVATIIGHDVNLSVGLLKMVNNVAVGTKVEITSLKQAAAYLGEESLKQFVSILALSKLTSDSTDEIAKQSLVTGKLMSSIAAHPQFKEIREYAFITGLLSSMEVLLKMPMAEIMATMPLAEQIRNALINRSGLLGELLVLTSRFIQGQDDIEPLLANFELEKDVVAQEFVKASKWVASLDI
ncbi:HDOD domain-containing protein [Thalassotalea sp. LPB0316]|uniref:EAL and HDOD domain-containing protein n=1 Tax=Thalassotalea sp. LPB0316 TaxID=2769490 RepID=UPI0018674156|nr:HDOD domain-containing protein [Thalassotalea sp. LPB0316]QOL25312.1 HDOD domain-containing protein [Thalassotalea sp. LPB0316]